MFACMYLCMHMWHMCIYVCIWVPMYACMHVCIHVSLCCLSCRLSVCLSGCLAVWLSAFLAGCLSVCLSVSTNTRNTSFLINFWSVQPTETSFKSGGWKVRNEAILWELSQKMEIHSSKKRKKLSWQHQKRSNSAKLPSKMESLQSWRLLANSCCDFAAHVSKVLRLPQKSEARPYEVLHLFTQNRLSELDGLMLQDASPLRKSEAWPPNMHASLQILLKRPMRAIVFRKCRKKTLTFGPFLWKCKIHCACQEKFCSNVQKCSKHAVFSVLTSKWLNVLGAVATAVYIFSTALSSTSKSAPTLVCLQHFDLEMCLDAHPARWLRTGRFSKPTSRPSIRNRKTLEKETVFRDFSTFWRILIFVLLTLSLLWLFPQLLLHLSIGHLEGWITLTYIIIPVISQWGPYFMY